MGWTRSVNVLDVGWTRTNILEWAGQKVVNVLDTGWTKNDPGRGLDESLNYNSCTDCAVHSCMVCADDCCDGVTGD